MANETGLNQPFIPTDNQREMVIRLKAFNVQDVHICKLVINPASGKPIAYETFRKVFEAELLNARLIELEKSTSVMKKTMYSENEELAYKAATKNYQLCSKGLLDPKADIKPEDSSKTKINKIVDGINNGSLSTFEADSMTKAIEIQTKVAMDELNDKLELITKKLKEKGIEI